MPIRCPLKAAKPLPLTNLLHFTLSSMLLSLDLLHMCIAHFDSLRVPLLVRGPNARLIMIHTYASGSTALAMSGFHIQYLCKQRAVFTRHTPVVENLKHPFCTNHCQDLPSRPELARLWRAVGMSIEFSDGLCL